MTLNGKLDELSPPEIFQLIGLTRKTGKLAMSRGDQNGVVVFRDGKIVFAASDNLRSAFGESLAGKMATTATLVEDPTLNHPREVTDSGTFLLQVSESGPGTLDRLLRSQIEVIVRGLVQWREGSFTFDSVDVPDAGDIGVDQSWFLDQGVDSDNLLLRTLTKLDERDRGRWERALERAANKPAEASTRQVPQSELSAAFEVLVDNSTGEISWVPLTTPTGPARKLASLREIMGEMSEMKGMSPSLTADVTLLILRYAAQVMNRGVLLAQRGDFLQGIGQFGLVFSSGSADQRVRDLKFPMDQPSVLSRVARHGIVFKGKLRGTEWDDRLIVSLGGGTPAGVVAMPLVIEETVVAVLYGDNLPDSTLIGTVDGLEILMHEIAIAVEKARLLKRVEALEKG